jgi:hypothetical protein
VPGLPVMPYCYTSAPVAGSLATMRSFVVVVGHEHAARPQFAAEADATRLLRPLRALGPDTDTTTGPGGEPAAC